MNKSIIVFYLILFSPFIVASPLELDSQNSTTRILNEIGVLEAKNDPKCHATASRLEDFMYGTPLTKQARFEKNKFQKQIVLFVWQWAQQNKAESSKEITEKLITQAFQQWFEAIQQENGDWNLLFNNKAENKVIIKATDLRQYRSIAYSLRAILAVQQDNILSNTNLSPLSTAAIKMLKQKLDLLSLSLLQKSDYKARIENRYLLREQDIVQASLELGIAIAKTDKQALRNQGLESSIKPSIKAPLKPSIQKSLLITQIIEKKIDAYKHYNNISNQLFVRNLQVYFARRRWPEDEKQAKQLKQTIIDSITQYAKDLYIGAIQLANVQGKAIIEENDVSQVSTQLLPYIINEYEDVIFFPNLDSKKQINIESYDMDSFRDTSLHWKYIDFALNDLKQQQLLDSDPFAAEILSENIAQYAVLLLRLSGGIAKQLKHEDLLSEHIVKAVSQIKILTENNNNKHQHREEKQLLASSDLEVKVDNYFTDITTKSGINAMHRSSDWLNRLLRSYLKKNKATGIITIPPAFGGSGVAAEDINNDGYIDILLLSGIGNHLYLNDTKGKFIDITQASGLNWKRQQDKKPGEPRQPLIADINNDGWQDIIITYVNDQHKVYKNLGNGKFKDISDISNLGGVNKVVGPATIFDYNNDGLLDIYISNFGNYLNGTLPTLKRRNDNGTANQLFKNTGDFTFKDVTAETKVGDTGWGQALTHTDINMDGWQDLIVGNDFGVNRYFINQKGNYFIDRSVELRTAKPSYTMNTSVADLNRDLIPDIYISNIVTMNKDQKYVLPNDETTMEFNANKLAEMRVVEANDLFLSSIGNDKKIKYQHSDVVGRGYSSTGWSWDADFFDADLDGDDDLYVLNGMNEFNLYSNKNPYYTDPQNNKMAKIHIPVSTKESNVFFLNIKGKLQNISSQSGLDLLGNSRSAAYLDYDNDGDLDVILNNYHEKAYFYKNNADRLNNNWIKIRVLGDPEKGVNRDAIGTKIVVSSDQGHQIWREVHGSTGYLSVHPKIQHFGIGKSTQVTVYVYWSNGHKNKIEKVPVNKSYMIDLKNNEFSLF